MKVLHVFKTYYPYSKGGIEKVIYELVTGMTQYNVHSDILSFADKNEIIDDGTSRTIFLKKNVELASTPLSISALWKFRKIIKDYDLIHYHFPYPFMDVMHFFSFTKKPYIVTYHSDIIKQKTLLKFYRPLARLFLKKANKIIATSPNYLQSSKLLQHFVHETEVIPLGINDRGYQGGHQSSKNWDVILGEKPFFLFIGVIRYYKGLHILIDAAHGADYNIVILGSGPIERELKEQVKSKRMNNVHFVGALEDQDKIQLLKLCLAVVFPSHLRSEAFGLSLVEGAMFSKPLISSEIGTGTTYINIHNETGIVVPPSDSKALRKAMDRLWQNNELAKDMGQNAYKRYQELFTADKMVSSYMEQYKKILAAN